MTGIDVLSSLLFVSMALGSFELSRIIYNDRFAPLGLYLGVTFASLALWHLRLASLTPISLLVYFIILLSVVGFTFGVFLASPSKRFCTNNGFDSCRSLVKGSCLRGFFYTIGVLATIGWLVLLLLFISKHSLASVWEHPERLQYDFQSTQYIGYLNVLGILVLPTYVMLIRTKRGVGWLASVFVVSALVGLTLSGIKTYIIFSFATAFLVWGNCRRKGLPFLHIVLLALFSISFMVAYDQIIDTSTSQPQAATSIVGSISPTLYKPYVYSVGSWSALTVLADNPLPQPIWGYNTMFFLWKVLGSGLHLIEPVSPYAEFVNISETGTLNFNVYSMAGGLYWDFGLIGVLLGSALLGYISTYLYMKSKMSHDWAWTLASSIINYGLFISFFLYYFTFNLLFLFLVVLMVIALRSALVFCSGSGQSQDMHRGNI